MGCRALSLCAAGLFTVPYSLLFLRVRAFLRRNWGQEKFTPKTKIIMGSSRNWTPVITAYEWLRTTRSCRLSFSLFTVRKIILVLYSAIVTITLSKDLLVTKKKQKGQQNGTPGCQSSILEINWRNIVVHCVTMQLLIASTVYEVY